MSRLRMGDRAVADRITAAGQSAQRQVAAAVTAYVLNLVPITGAQELLAALSAGEYGDSPLRQWLETQGDEADSERLMREEDIQQAQQDGRDITRLDQERRRWRNVARAHILAYYALDPDSDEAAQEVVYEASFILDKSDLTALVQATLNGQR
ncbi:hypothetical protein [Fodinicola feengrottensis]|uniref:hypothetical protein n=1 Tax=Fodinicola feengrottensis TaxID=435914 RepID=UPI00244282B8|nr:hypothetical protein [Fodinicola feengrottensis]